MRSFLLMSAIALLGCARTESVPITFAVTEFAPEETFSPGVEAQAGDEAIEISGALHGSLCASAPAAAASREDRTVTLRISFGRRSAVPCPTTVRALRYDAVLADLEPGSYELRVVHVTRGLKRNVNEVLVQRIDVR